MSTEKTHRILIVDDDPTVIKLLDSRLQAQGFDVLSSMEASAGLQKAINENPDLIILDVMMPIINGYNFCRLLKSQEGHSHIPVIFLTSRDKAEDQAIGAEMGAEVYLTKPINIDVLLKHVQEQIDKASAS